MVLPTTFPRLPVHVPATTTFVVAWRFIILLPHHAADILLDGHVYLPFWVRAYTCCITFLPLFLQVLFLLWVRSFRFCWRHAWIPSRMPTATQWRRAYAALFTWTSLLVLRTCGSTCFVGSSPAAVRITCRSPAFQFVRSHVPTTDSFRTITIRHACPSYPLPHHLPPYLYLPRSWDEKAAVHRIVTKNCLPPAVDILVYTGSPPFTWVGYGRRRKGEEDAAAATKSALRSTTVVYLRSPLPTCHHPTLLPTARSPHTRSAAAAAFFLSWDHGGLLGLLTVLVVHSLVRHAHWPCYTCLTMPTYSLPSLSLLPFLCVRLPPCPHVLLGTW